MQTQEITLFARRAANPGMAATYINRPDAIALAWGLPDPRLFPANELVAASQRILNREAARVLQYGPMPGDPALVGALAVRGRGQVAAFFNSSQVSASGAPAANQASISDLSHLRRRLPSRNPGGICRAARARPRLGRLQSRYAARPARSKTATAGLPAGEGVEAAAGAAGPATPP